MANHPRRGRKPNLMYITPWGHARIVLVDDDGCVYSEIVNCRLNKGGYVRIDDGSQYPQLCEGAARRGATLTYSTPEDLAADCNARLFKTEARFEAAKARLERAE